MAKFRYRITELLTNQDRRNFQVIDLKEASKVYRVTVYVHNTKPRCLNCQTPVLSGSCPHAQAIRRLLYRERDAVELAEVNTELIGLFEKEE